MVWGVCRRLLGHHDAEDAFQATFLVLVRKAASVVPRELVGNFLYGVAHQTTLQARRTAARRRAREVQVTVMPDTEAVQQDQWLDVKPLLDQELNRLPDIYRTVVVLCDLEGRTRKEVARKPGVPEGTVAGRLARARAMLAKRFTERGVTLSGGVLAAVLARNVACGGVPNSVVSSTIKAASLLAAGQVAAGGAISVKVAALKEGVMKAMLFTKLRAALAVVLILGFVATGATILSCRTAAGQDDKKPAAEKPVEPAAKQEKENETFTARGKEVGGLQAGLGYPPGQRRTTSTWPWRGPSRRGEQLAG
jgi:RNA polymerase sigma factor (sigma-70 family)